MQFRYRIDCMSATSVQAGGGSLGAGALPIYTADPSCGAIRSAIISLIVCTWHNPSLQKVTFVLLGLSLRLPSAQTIWLRREDSVHDLGAGGDYGAQLAAVDQLRRAGLLVTGETGDLLDRDAACGHDADEGVAQLPGNPLVAETCCRRDLGEPAPG